MQHIKTMSNVREYKHMEEYYYRVDSITKKHLTFFSHIRVLTVVHGVQVLVTQLKDFEHRAGVRSI